jgi:nitroreductase
MDGSDESWSVGGHPRVEVILRRRSYRSFRPDPLPDAGVDALRSVLATAPTVLGERSGYALLIDDAERARRLPEAVTSGLIGKINPWLTRSQPPAFLVAAGDSRRGVRDGDRHYYNVDGAVAAQLAVLEAAGLGVGSCWVGGFHESSVARVARLPDGHRPLAVIPLGLPAVGPASGGSLFGRGWDAAAQRLVSGRRKPLERVAFRGSFRRPYAAGAPVPGAARGVDDAQPRWPGVGPFRPASRFADRPVPPEAIPALLECARWAPSAENSQIARHVVVDGREAVADLLAAAFPGVNPPAGGLPPLAIVSLAAPFPVKARTAEQPFFLIDVPIAVTNVLVAGADFGLGWQAAFRFDHRAVAACVGAPDDHRAVALVGLGVPDAAPSGPASPLDQLHAGTTR